MTRLLLHFLLLVCLGRIAAGQAGHGFGAVNPVLVPDVEATRHDGTRVRLRAALAGKRTAVQFVFVDCQTACPLLGSLFRKVDRAVADSPVQLVSITVNPERDTPERLAEWRQQFGASPRWLGLRLSASDLKEVLRVFGQESGPPTGHTLQVFLVDEAARYVARTVDLPTATAVAEELRVGALQAERPAAERSAASTGQDLFAGRGGLTATIGGDRLAEVAARCSSCHGTTASGGGEGKTVVPALTATALKTVQPRRGGPPSIYTQTSFCVTLRTGVDPSGVALSPVMPRYQLDGRACAQLWGFLTGGR
jgi:cytochrome oxidase Cu insertion factor (SCO1/SenC/PrrC family)